MSLFGTRQTDQATVAPGQTEGNPVGRVDDDPDVRATVEALARAGQDRAAAERRWRELQQTLRQPEAEPLVVAEAKIALPAAEHDVLRARAVATTAAKSHEAALARARERWRPGWAARYRKTLRELDAQLQLAREANEAARAEWAAAYDAGVTLPAEGFWPELLGSDLHRPSRLDQWRAGMAREGWL
jgi:hypothetical protein